MLIPMKMIAGNGEERAFKYVQIKRNVVNTFFSKDLILQINDISQKIMCNKANGEKRFLSTINATISHEMRNPMGAIRVHI